jgi:hypothetical protein
MADNMMTEQDDDELIPVETPPEEEDDQTQQVADDDDSDDDEEDARLAESEDDSEDDIVNKNHDRRAKRRERQKRARDAAQRELQMLRETVAALSQRVSATESYAANSNSQTLQQQLNDAINEVRQAETIIAKATEAGNGEDVVAAMRIRDAAIAKAQQLNSAREQFEQVRQQVGTPQADPAVLNYSREWMQANPWYDPTGRDRDSALTNAIDNELTSEGYNPATREYWEELTARVADAINGGDDSAAPAQSKPRRKGPPTGNTREHAPVSTKKEIYVTPERKAAMIEAGVWDDPVQRQRYLKAYQAYDNGSAR